MQNIIVVGAGASGMTAAVTAARAGAKVTILEQNDIAGKKILSTGNGRCNLTNLNLNPTNYRGDSPGFAETALSTFGVQEALDFFAGIGVYTKCRGEYVYPLCDQASAVREAFVMELKHLGVRTVTGCRVEKIAWEKGNFHLYCNGNQTDYYAPRVILAAGSRASAISGSDGSGYSLARELGHSISPVVPALVQLQAEESFFKKLAGIRTMAEVAICIDGKRRASDTGELQLTDYGISGIPVFQISRYAAKALQENRRVTVRIDFLPQMSKEELLLEILSRKGKWGRRTAQELLNTLFPAKLIPVLLDVSGIEKTLWAKKVSDERWNAFCGRCKMLEVHIKETNSFKKAQVCAGGVRTDEISPYTMESLVQKGLYITGELLDIDGICGGYNLHFAWASGALAGKYAAK